MPRHWISVLVLCLTAAGAALATESRNQAMQARGWIIPDDSNVWQLPGELLDYRDAVYGELPMEVGTADYAGGHVSLRSLLLRVFVGELPGRGASAEHLDRVRAMSYPVGNVQARGVENNQLCRGELPAGRVHILLGAPLGGKAQGAVGLDYYHETWTDLDRPAPPEGGTPAAMRALDQARLVNLIGGVALPLGPFERVSLGARLGLPAFEGWNEVASLGPSPYTYKAIYEDDGGSSLGLTVRGTLRNLVAENSESFLYLQMESGHLDGESRHNTLAEQTALADSRIEMKQRAFTAGWSNLHHFGEKLMVVWSAALEWDQSRVDVTDEAFTESDPASFTQSRATTVSWPLTIGVEGWIRPWWAARFSSASSLALRVTSKARYDDRRYPRRSVPESRSTNDLSEERLSIGTTLKLAEFRIDGVVNRSLLFDGPNFLGGSSTGLVSQMSLSYQF